MTKPTSSNELPPERNPLRTILERHGIDDPSQFLIDHKDVPIDTTPRIDGVPLISQEEVKRRMRTLRSCSEQDTHKTARAFVLFFFVGRVGA